MTSGCKTFVTGVITCILHISKVCQCQISNVNISCNNLKNIQTGFIG